MRLKVLFVIPYFAPAWGYGGPARLAFDYARGLVKRGHKVTVYASDALGQKSKIIKKHDYLDGIEIFYLPNLSNFLAWRKIFLPLGFPKLLAETIKNFDVVHCFDFRTYQNIWVHRYALKNKKPYVVSVLGQTGWGIGVRMPIKRIYDFFWGKKILQNASLVSAQNDHEKEDLENFGIKKEKIALLPLALDFSEFKILPKRGTFRQKYKIKKEDFLILFIGRIHYLKGIDFLIKALPKIKKKIKNVKLAVVGRDDGYLETLKKLVEEKVLKDSVIFTGPIYEKERICAYRDADVFTITPRHYEETSLASLEAAACGIPMIVNQKCQVPYLNQYKAGVELSAESAESISMAMADVIAQKGEMGKMAKKMVREKFALEVVTNRLEEIYHEVISR